MAKNLKNEYQKYVGNTAPDMDKLWDRIEEKIDNSPKTYEPQRHITYSSGKSKRFAAVAASLAVIFAGAYIWSQNSGNNISKTSKNDNDSAVKSYESENNKQEYTENAIFDEKKTISYSQLSFEHTNSPSYETSYPVSGDEYFVRSKVLEETEFFADVTVEKAEIGTNCGTYTLKVHRLISKSGEIKETSITIESSARYILQENRSYFIPLKKSGNEYAIVFENAPQIEITLDEQIVYPNHWDLGENYSNVTLDKKNYDDFYYDRMRLSDENSLQALVEEWKQM